MVDSIPPPAPLPPPGPTAPRVVPPAVPPAVPRAVPPLRRSSERAVLAGVCAGAARRFGIDPTVVRVLAVVLALFGGIGVLLYALGWLLMPEDGSGRSVGERALRGADGTGTVLLAVGLVLVVGVVGAGIVRGSWFPVWLLAVLLLVGGVLMSRRSSNRPERPVYPYSGVAPSGPVSPEASGFVPTDDPAYPSGYRPGIGLNADAPGWSPAVDVPVDVAPAPREPRSRLGLLTVSVAVVAVGVLGLADVAGAVVPASAYLALPLAVVGLGLVAGTWVGRSRGLVALGIVLAVLLAMVAVLEAAVASRSWDEAFADRVVAPTTAVGLDGRVVELGVGDLVYDLSAVAFPEGSTQLALRVGAGSVTVVVPDDVAVVLDAEVGAGQLDAFGSATEGAGLVRSQREPGTPGAGTLELDVQVGLGDVEVNRAQA